VTIPTPRPFCALPLSLCIFCCLPSLAGAADTEQCRNGSFPAQVVTFGLARVVGAPRTYLRLDTPPCPDDSANCRGRAYVVPDDTVLTGGVAGSYVCAFFPGRNGGSAGYVRKDEIAAQPAISTVPLTAWVGEWRNGDDSITLRPAGLGLTTSGSAYWPSAHPSLKERPGGPNLGNMSGTATPTGNTIVFAGQDPTDCRVSLTLLPALSAGRRQYELRRDERVVHRGVPEETGVGHSSLYCARIRPGPPGPQAPRPGRPGFPPAEPCLPD
jgi:hypothetical protein